MHSTQADCDPLPKEDMSVAIPPLDTYIISRRSNDRGADVLTLEVCSILPWPPGFTRRPNGHLVRWKVWIFLWRSRFIRTYSGHLVRGEVWIFQSRSRFTRRLNDGRRRNGGRRLGDANITISEACVDNLSFSASSRFLWWISGDGSLTCRRRKRCPRT